MNQRFFFDASLIGVARIIGQNRDRVTYPGHSNWPFGQDEDDEVWLQLVGDRGWCAIFRDKRIRYRTTERAALERHRARAVVIATNRNLTIEDNVALLEQYWHDIEQTLVNVPALYHLTSTGLEKKLTYR